MSESKAREAAQLYLDLQARRKHPIGSFDRQRRWYPSDGEEQPCCHLIRRPSARYPYSLMRHCRSIEHVASIYRVPVADVRYYVREITDPGCHARTVARRREAARLRRLAKTEEQARILSAEELFHWVLKGTTT